MRVVRVSIAILVSVLMASTAHAKRVALVVGIDKYDTCLASDSWPRL
jgi:hypothetical protein